MAAQEKALISCRHKAEKLRIRLEWLEWNYKEWRVIERLKFSTAVYQLWAGQGPNWKKCNLKIWNGENRVNALENLESPDSPEPLSPREVPRSGVC